MVAFGRAVGNDEQELMIMLKKNLIGMMKRRLVMMMRKAKQVGLVMTVLLWAKVHFARQIPVITQIGQI